VTERKLSDKRSRRGCRHAKFHEEADRILAEVVVFLFRRRAMYPDGPPERYLRALFAMADDAAVRRKAAWLIEQQSRFSRSHLSPRRPKDILGHCLYVTAWNIASGRTALKLQEVAERRATLLEAAALARAEAEAAASLGYRDNALKLRLKAADIEDAGSFALPGKR
jgi:hypothetical protein